MSARARGDHDDRPAPRWRPLPPPAAQRDAFAHREARRLITRQTRPRGAAGWMAVAMVVLICAGVAVSRIRAMAPAPHAISSAPTPRAWFDAYLAAAVDNPRQVCRVLFAPELAASYQQDGHGTCLRYFDDVIDAPVRITRIVRSGATAVIDLSQRRPPQYQWSVVLNDAANRWQAVALIRNR